MKGLMKGKIVPENTSLNINGLKFDRFGLTFYIGIAAIFVVLICSAFLLLYKLPDANAFNSHVEKLFVSTDLSSPMEIQLLELMAESGTAFSQTLETYRYVILILFSFSSILLLAALLFFQNILSLGNRMSEVERAGILINSLILNRDEKIVLINNFELNLTDAACETLAVLCEARLDDEVISGTDIESIISGKSKIDCDEANGAMRIKRLRDHLGNQMMSELMIKNVSKKGYILSIDKGVIKVI